MNLYLDHSIHPGGAWKTTPAITNSVPIAKVTQAFRVFNRFYADYEVKMAEPRPDLRRASDPVEIALVLAKILARDFFARMWFMDSTPGVYHHMYHAIYKGCKC